MSPGPPEPAATQDLPGRRLARAGLLAVLLASVGLTVLLAGRSPADAQADLVAEGNALYQQGCVSCHGPEGGGVRVQGEERGPSLRRSGAAVAYYMLETGRMPLNDPDEQPHRKERAYEEAEIEALVAYVATLGEGPPLPDIDLEDADLAAGGLVFRGNCQACHSASGAGGALSYGRAAPGLRQSEPLVVGAAVRSGPGQMPSFGEGEISDERLNDLVEYVQFLQDPPDPGGIHLSRIGPVPEGFVAWFVGVVLLLACVYWIGTRSPIRRRRRT
ncbi:MAG TPA: c-type cytochrome [Aquihabitans sp.]|jgi:ubiquinol-cytochrome c reductase cytochrome c subunit|nr:c-type cytochrome [Aquihabitans sp.]